MENISTYIKDKYVVPFCTASKSYEIKEDDIGTHLKNVIIEGIDGFSLCIKYDDETDGVVTILNRKKKNINRACDAIVFSKKSDKLKIYLIELKSREYSVNEIWSKFCNTKELVCLIANIYERYEERNVDISLAEFRYILYSTKNPKKGTRPSISKKEYKDIEYYDEYAYTGKRFNIKRYS